MIIIIQVTISLEKFFENSMTFFIRHNNISYRSANLEFTFKDKNNIIIENDRVCLTYIIKL